MLRLGQVGGVSILLISAATLSASVVGKAGSFSRRTSPPIIPRYLTVTVARIQG